MAIQFVLDPDALSAILECVDDKDTAPSLKVKTIVCPVRIQINGSGFIVDPHVLKELTAPPLHPLKMFSGLVLAALMGLMQRDIDQTLN